MFDENSALPTSPRVLSAEPLTVHLDLRDGRLTVTGRLTRSSAHLLQDAVSTMIDTGRASWLVDLAGADLSSAVGLQAVGTAYRRLLRRGCRMTLTGADPALQKRLIRSRLDQHVSMAPGSSGVSTPTLEP